MAFPAASLPEFQFLLSLWSILAMYRSHRMSWLVGSDNTISPGCLFRPRNDSFFSLLPNSGWPHHALIGFSVLPSTIVDWRYSRSCLGLLSGLVYLSPCCYELCWGLKTSALFWDLPDRSRQSSHSQRWWIQVMNCWPPWVKEGTILWYNHVPEPSTCGSGLGRVWPEPHSC